LEVAVKTFNSYQEYDRSPSVPSSLTDKLEWMTTKEVAVYLSVSEAQVRNWASNGTIVYHKLGRLNRYLKSEIDALLLTNKRGGIL